VVFAEPDIDQIFDKRPEDAATGGAALALAEGAPPHTGQDGSHNKAVGPSVGWHLGDDYSQLKSAREAVPFSDPRTRIAHLDTGYDRNHVARPERIVLEHSFVEGDPNPNRAEPGATLNLLPQNLDHGTGTVGILAGGRVPLLNNDFLGGAPGADIVELRIANSVVLIDKGSFFRALQFKVSAFVQALQFAIDNRCDALSMSLGGLPSRAWSETVNKAYEAGLCICAAAGNNFGGAPSPHVVYPARYHRVIAVCGVMANQAPYWDIPPDFPPKVFQGSWGPASSMTAAIASYTPNIPWPVWHSDEIRENGEGTSSATPQVAAAVALWLEKYKDFHLSGWQRVEAVRHALFSSAKPAKNDEDARHLGHGILQARKALDVTPRTDLPKTDADEDSFAFLRVITGLGITEKPPRELMYNLELTQLYLKNIEVDGRKLQDIIRDPGADVSDQQRKEFMDAVIASRETSNALRKQIIDRYPAVYGGKAPAGPLAVELETRPVIEKEIKMVDPPFRRLRCYAVDPSFSTQLETVSINDVVLNVRWESFDNAEGKTNTSTAKATLKSDRAEFTGEYLRIDREHVKVRDKELSFLLDLNDPKLLAQDGWPPSEGNPEFHQQMVYAVAMKTIEHFERALGRRVLWRAEQKNGKPEFVGQLTIKPHAMEQANAFYSPKEIALLFGYFEASASDPGDHSPGSRVYACLSHDIIAHETTHAILDGMHKQFNEATNPDVLAFHEAFADIVALMQHFTIPEILENAITRTRGDLESQSTLGTLAVQFGKAMGGRGALRDAIGKVDKDGKWTRQKPDPADYGKTMEPHARGALLVAAVFDAFLAIYKTRTADLLRIYTGGTGVLPAGAIHPDLVHRLAAEAAKTAGHVLNICIRALDYIPPVDITFGEYLRGLITADADLVPDDRFHYRVAFVESFRKRGMYPLDLDTLSVDTLRWQGVDLFEPIKDPEVRKQFEKILRDVLEQLKKYSDACFYLPTRKRLFEVTQDQIQELKDKLNSILSGLPEKQQEWFGWLIGIDPTQPFEVSELRRAVRVSPDGQHKPQIIIALSQSRPLKIDESSEELVFHGGSTLIVDLSQREVQYTIGKRLDSHFRINGQTREERTATFMTNAMRDPLQRLLLTPKEEPFAALHSFGDVGS
jgi:hypothetical protein